MRWFFKLVAQCKVWLATYVAHLVKPEILKHHATKQQIICLSSVSSVKLDVPFSWPSVVVLQVGSTVQTMIGHLCGTSCEASEFETSCNRATNHLFIKRFKRQAWCTFFWPSVVVLQVGSTVQTMIGHLCGTSCEASEFETSCNRATNHLFIKRFKRQAWCTFFLTKCGGSSSWQHSANYDWLPLWHILWSQRLWNIMQQSKMSYFCQAFQASSLMYLFLDQVRWFFKLVAQCKVWLATYVAHLVKPEILKHHATKQQIICLSSVSSVKLDVPFSWPSVVVLQVGSTVQTMIGHLCGTSCEASEFETSCNSATNHLFIKRFKRQAWCTFFLTKCGGSSSW